MNENDKVVRKLREEISELKLTLSGQKVVSNADNSVQANSARKDKANSESKDRHGLISSAWIKQKLKKR